MIIRIGAITGIFGALFLAFIVSSGVSIAGETEQIFPDLTISEQTWSFNFPKAVFLSDRFLEKARRLSSYTCRTKVFYSLSHIQSSNRKVKAPGKPDEEFDLTIFYRPMTAFVRLLHPRKGATVFYRSVDRVTEVRPFSFIPFALSLSPHSSLISSRFGHTIDHSDFQSFDKRVFRPACLTHSCLYLGLGQFRGRTVDIINIAPDQLEARPVFGRMWVLLDHETTLPLSVATYGPTNRFWERIDYRQCHFSYR